MSNRRKQLSLSLVLMTVVTMVPAFAQINFSTNGGGLNFGNRGFNQNGYYNGNNSFGGNQFGGNPYGGNQFNNNSFNSVSDQLRNIDKQADGVVKNVQFFLQANGRWSPPQGKDAALCMTLEALKNGLKQSRRAADSNDPNKLVNQLYQLSVISQNTVNAAQQAGLDAGTIGQLQRIQNDIQVTSSLAGSGGVLNPSGGFNPGGFSGGLTLVNTQMISPNQLSVSWRQQNGQILTYTSQVNSFMLSDGASVRPAVGQEVNMLSTAYSQAGNYNGGGGYRPNGFRPDLQPGMLQASGSGRGQFTMMGQVFMNIRTTTISASDPAGHRGVLTITAGRDKISLMGKLINQSPASFVFNIDGSDRGAASGSIMGSLNGNGQLNSVNGTGVLNGQAFNLSFRS